MNGPTVTPRGSPLGGLGAESLSLDETVHILLVDDQAANLDALEATLTSTGCRSVLARNPDAALLALLERDFAAIVLDVAMPTMSGFELAAMIRRRQRTQHVPILFLTAYMLERADELRGYAAGAVDYLIKPVHPDILRTKIGVFVDLFRKRRALTRANVELQRQIAERQRLAEELRRANESLETRVAERTAALADSNRRKDEFLAVLGHELRTPLTALAWAAEGLRGSSLGAADLERMQGLLQRQVRQLTRLTEDLLDINRINRGKLLLRQEPVELRDVIVGAVEMVRPLIDERRHALAVDLPASPLPVNGDRARLTQVFANLLDNAARYTEAGGAGRIRVSAEIAADHVLVKVEDNGRGIERELLPRVFDRFMQGVPGESGLGIGLALARQLVELHAGSISAYSAGPASGAEFVVRLPLAHPAPAPPQDVEAAAERPRTLRPGGRILIVEDDRDVASLLSIMLTNWGQETRVAHDGLAALELAEQFRPDVVLLDVGLPRLHGYEVARRLRQQPWGQQVLIIALTGWGLRMDRHGEAAGIDHRLLKPIDPAVLRELLVAVQPAAPGAP